MQSLARLVTKPDIGGEPIPNVFRMLARHDVIFRKGELAFMAGQPGAGKTALAMTIARKAKVPTLYLCPDSSAMTIVTRYMSQETGRPRGEVEQGIYIDPDWTQTVLGKADHIRWSFSGALTLDDIDEEVQAFQEMWGEPPCLIVIDNLIDVSGDEGEEFQALRATCRALKYMARSLDACVLVLHHTSEGVESKPCPPRRAIHGKVAQLPALILTIATSPGTMLVAPVKNRHGPADATGSTAYFLKFDPTTMTVSDPE